MFVKTLHSFVFAKRNEEFDDLVLLTKLFNKHADKVLVRASTIEDSKCLHLLKEFKHFSKAINEITSFADQHDYKNIPANGFRSFVKIWTRLLEVAITLPSDQGFEEFLGIFSLANILMEDLKHYHNRDPLKDYDAELSRKNLERFMNLLVTNHEIWSVLNQPAFAYVQLGKSLKIIGHIYRKFAALRMPHISYITAFKSLFDQASASTAMSTYLAHELCLEHLTNVVRYGDRYSEIMETMLSLFRAITGAQDSTPAKSSYPEVSSPYRLQVSAQGVDLVKNEDCSEKRKIHARIVKSDFHSSPDQMSNGHHNNNHGNQYDKKLLIYLHGGAFCGPKAQSCERIYVKKWCTAMPGLSIVNFDYSLGPEERFPTAVQELLDFYLWLRCYNNSEEEVIKVLGFVPEDIVLAGESAGGNMTTAVTVALNEIKHKFDPTIKMPKGLILMYSKLVMNYQFFPSMLNTMVDLMIPPHIFPLCAQAYIPFRVKDEETDSLRLMRKEEQIKLSRSDVSASKISWLDSHFISPLRYDKFDQMTETTLHILTFDYDPFIDESILLAKRWPGRVQFKVLDETCHGAILLRNISLEGFAANLEAEHLIRCSLLY